MISWRCTILLLLTSLQNAAFGLQAPPPGYSYNLQGKYDVDFTTDANGGCHSHEQHIKDAFDEALEMVDLARDAMEGLRDPMPPDTQLAAQNDWKRKAEVYYAMFHSETPKSGLNNNDAYFVRGVLEGYLANHYWNSGMMSKQFILRCDVNWLSYKPPDWDDPRNPGAKIGDDPRFEHGVFYAPTMPINLRYLWWDGAKPSSASLCNPEKEELAATFWRLSIMVLCPHQLEVEHWSMAAEKNRIQAKSHIDKYAFTIAQTWVHEWGHLIRGWPDQPAFNKLGLPYTFGITKEFTYRWPKSVFLAEADSELAQLSPENYSYFAAAMYWSNWFWGTGYAKTAPK